MNKKRFFRCQLKTDPLHPPSIHRHKVRSAAVVIKKISKNRLEQQQQHLLDTLSGEWLAGWQIGNSANLASVSVSLSVSQPPYHGRTSDLIDWTLLRRLQQQWQQQNKQTQMDSRMGERERERETLCKCAT